MSGHHHQDLMHGFHFLPVEYVHQMFLIRSVYLLCQIWKVKVIQFWWFEIKLASKKIAVMEEGVIDELVYNYVVDKLNFRFWT